MSRRRALKRENQTIGPYSGMVSPAYHSGTQPETALYAIDIYDPVYGVAQALPLLPSIDQRELRRGLTAYSQDLWDVTARVSLVGGVRLDTYSQELRKNLTGASRARATRR